MFTISAYCSYSCCCRFWCTVCYCSTSQQTTEYAPMGFSTESVDRLETNGGGQGQTLFMSGWINEMTGTAIQDLYNWLVVSTPLKNISQLGLFFPIYGKITNVPNHQPDKYVQQETLVFFGNKWVAIQKQCCHQGDTVPWITSHHSKIDHLFTSLPLDANKLL